MIKTQREYKNIFPLILLSIATLTLLEISFESAIITVFFLTIVALFGIEISVKVGFNDCGVGIGTVVGVGLFVFSTQILLIIGITSAVSHWSVILIMTVLVCLSSSSNLLLIKSEHWSKPQNFTALSLALIVATLRQPWMLPFTCVVVATGIWILGKKFTLKRLTIISTLTSVGWFTSFLVRPENWWYVNSNGDSQFFESLSWSIAKWGVFEHPGFAGGSIANYHWLNYAILGGISEVAQLEPWSALLKIGPLFLYFLLAQLIVSEAQASFHPNSVWHWTVVAMGIATTKGQFADSWALSIVVALVFLFLERQNLRAPKLKLLLFWSYLSTVLLFAKLSTAVVVATILSIKMFLDQKNRRPPQIAPLFSLIFIGIAVAIPISQGNVQSMFHAPRFSTIAVMDLMVSLISVERLFPNLLIWTTSALLLRFLLKKRLGPTGLPIAALTLPSILTSALFYADFAEGKKLGVARASAEYFLFTPAILLTILCSIAMLSVNTEDYFKKKTYQNALMISLLFCGFVAGSYWRYQSLGVLFGKVISFQTLSIIVLIGAFSVISLFTIFKKFRKYHRKSVLSFFVLISGVVSSFWVNDFIRNINNPAAYYSIEETAAPNLGTSDLIAVGKHIRDNTSPEMVLASNNFYLNRFQGGENYLLPAETRRRFLIQGLSYQTFFGTPSSEQMERMNLSIEFAENPSTISLKHLKEYGVEGYVVNLTLTERRDWSEFATEIFRSGNFVFMMLK